MAAERRYGEDEVRNVLKRAAALQQQSSRDATTEGLTAAELENVARESGLDPNHLRRALSEHHAVAGSRFERAILGGPLLLRTERVVDVGEGPLPTRTVVEEIERTLGASGLATGLPHDRVWSWRGRDRLRHWFDVEISVDQGRAVVAAETSVSGLATALFLPLVGAGAVIGGVIGAGLAIALLATGTGGVVPLLAGLALAAPFAGGGYLLARLIFGAASRRRFRRIGRLADRLQGLLQRTPASSEVDDGIPASQDFEDIAERAAFEAAERGRDRTRRRDPPAERET